MIRNIRATAGVCLYLFLVNPRARGMADVRASCDMAKFVLRQLTCGTNTTFSGDFRSNRRDRERASRWIEWRRELSRRKLLRQFHTPRTLCRAIHGAPKWLAHSGECSAGNFGVVLPVPLLRRSLSWNWSIVLLFGEKPLVEGPIETLIIGEISRLDRRDLFDQL